MGAEETDLEMVQRHIREGKRHLTKQKALVDDSLKASGLLTEEAEALLDTLKDVQGEHEAHRRRLEGKRDLPQ